MGRRTEKAAERAAQEASEAARTLGQRSHEARQERAAESASVEPAPESRNEPKTEADPSRIERLLEKRPHTQAMEEIVERRNKAEPSQEVAQPEVAPKPEPVAEVPPAVTPTETPAVPEAVKTVRVKVDGEEHDALQSDVDEAGGLPAYRIARAQENRLKKASETVAESKKLTAQLVEILSRQNQTPAAPQKSDAEFIEEKMDIVRFGTPKEAAAAWVEIQRRAQPQPVDSNALVNQVTAAIQRRTAVAEFGKQFPDITSNPLLVRLAVTLEGDEVAKAQKEGRPVDWGNLYSTIGNQVRSVVPQRQSQPSATPLQTASTPSQPSDKEARKASITVLPTAASARAELPREEKEPSPEEARKQWIAEQKKARGQG